MVYVVFFCPYCYFFHDSIPQRRYSLFRLFSGTYKTPRSSATKVIGSVLFCRFPDVHRAPVRIVPTPLYEEDGDDVSLPSRGGSQMENEGTRTPVTPFRFPLRFITSPRRVSLPIFVKGRRLSKVK